jgi:ATP-binding cassette subfamily B multidrug efflux pump
VLNNKISLDNEFNAMRCEMSSKSPLDIWWRDISSRWQVYVAGLFAMLLTNGTEVMAPKTLQWIIDALFNVHGTSESFGRVIKAVAVFSLVALLGVFGRVFWRLTLGRMTHVAGNQIKRGIWDDIRSSSMESLGRYTLGDLMNRSIGDVNAARWIYGQTMVLTCDVVFFTILGSVSMIWIHPGIALSCLATFILIPPLALRVARLERLAHEEAQAELTVLSENVSQAVRGVRSQRASQSFMSWVSALNESASRYAKLRLRSQSISINSFPLFSLATICSYGILLSVGPSLVADGKISIGEFAALASYVYLLQGPLGEIGELVAEWQRGFASLRRIAEIRNLDSHSDKTSAHESDDQNLLVISNLQVNRQGLPLFKGVSLTLPRQQWLGIKGAVGSGKSTLLQVICGVTPFEQGQVALGVFGRRDHRVAVAYAPEKPFVFSGTVRRNLSLNLKVTDEQLWDVLSLVELDRHVHSIPGGLDGMVGEGGVTLSGGQRQRLALARVLLRVNGLLVLDDPLSAVDAETEARIVSKLRKRFVSESIIWASNKVSTLKCCDLVLRLTSNGLVTDQDEISKAFAHVTSDVEGRLCQNN